MKDNMVSTAHVASDSIAMQHVSEPYAEPAPTAIQGLGADESSPAAMDQPSPGEEPNIGKGRSKWQISAIITALLLCVFAASLDVTIVATAVPVITNDLASASGYTWIGSAYLLANAVAGPIWGALSDIFGRKAVLLVAVLTFFVASTVCATAQTMQVLIAARALQGAAGGGLILLPHICVSDLFSLRQRSLFVGFMEAIWGLSSAIGPLLGGVFASLASWRWCFWINLPICGVTFLLIIWTLNIQHEHTTLADGLKALDWPGIATFLGFSCMLLLGLNFGGSTFAWDSSRVIALLVVSVVMIAAFIYTESRVAKYPLVPLRMFRNRSSVASLLVAFFHGMVFVAQEYYMPLYFQSVKGSSPLQSGALILPLLLSTAFSGVVTGLLVHRTGRYREVIWVGTALLSLAVGLLVMFDIETSTAEIVGIQIMAGLGAGALFWPPMLAVQAQVAQADVATATSTVSFIRSVALSVSLVIGGTVFQNSMDSRAPALQAAGLSESVLDQLSGKNAAANVMLANSLSDPGQQLAVREAFSASLKTMRIMYAVLAFCAVLASTMVVQTHLSKDHTEIVTGIKKEKVTG